MTTLTHKSFLPKIVEELKNLIHEVKKARIRNAAIKSTIRELNRLSDRELNDIGISRGEIWTVAHSDNDFKIVEANENINLKGWV